MHNRRSSRAGSFRAGVCAVRRRCWLAGWAALFVVLAVSVGSAPAGARPPSAAVASAAVPPVVIAVIGEHAFNPLHVDFRTGDGRQPALPAGMPATTPIVLPDQGSFDERLAAAERGPLGRLKPGVLYSIRGTRIIGLFTAANPGSSEVNVVGPDPNPYGSRFHGTGVLSAAGGRRHGTDPDALLVDVLGISRTDWEWAVSQPWIDIISTSYYAPLSCNDKVAMQQFAAAGGLIFSGVGDGEQAGLASYPSSSPDAYQVGGVNAQGRTWLPGDQGPSPFGLVLTPTRPYETGDSFNFLAADGFSLTGSQGFGGASGATPRTAGRAAQLLRHARTILGSGGRRAGLLASLGPGGHVPRRGPLADGSLTAAELTRLLHNTATPYEPPSPGRYFIEGYGATSDASQQLALDVLDGKTAEPSRPAEDAADELVTRAQRQQFNPTRCGIY